MLARSFLTADQLHIPQDWYDALVKVLHVMERGEIVHLPKVNVVDLRYYDDPDSRLFLGRFNMNYWQENADCGTVCCIGGAAEILGKIKFNNDQGGMPKNLHDLFYPPRRNSDIDYESITVEQAQEALRRYLILGEAQWNQIFQS